MYHYVYYSYEEWGRGYIGVRSCKCLPEEDVKYFGSYTDKTFAPTNKIILLTFETREEANAAEVALHAYYKVDENPHFANRAKQLTEHFVCRGERSAEVRGNMKRARQRWVEENKDKLSIIFAKSADKIKKYREENQDEINKNFVENVMELGRQYWKEHPEEASERSRRNMAKRREDPSFLEAQRLGREKNAKEKWQCTITGKISTKMGLTKYQRNRKIDTSNRVRLPDPSETYTNPQPDTQP